VQVVTDSAQLATLLSPLRMRVLEEMHEPQSATSLAPRLGLSRQKLNYHLRELEREGFLELVEERQRRGCVERRLQVTSRAFVVNPAMLGALADDPAQTRDRFSSAYLIAVATSLMRDVTLLRERAAVVEQKLAMFTMESEIRFVSPASFREFTEDLASAVAALAVKYDRPSLPGIDASRIGRRISGPLDGHWRRLSVRLQRALGVWKDACRGGGDSREMAIVPDDGAEGRSGSRRNRGHVGSHPSRYLGPCAVAGAFGASRTCCRTRNSRIFAYA